MIWHKRVDYIWLGTALLGILAASSHGDRTLSAQLLENVERPRTEFVYLQLRRYLESGIPVCLTYTKSQYSPPYVDSLVEEQRVLCQKARSIAKARAPALPISVPPLEQTGYVGFGQDAKYEALFVKETQMLAEEYRQQQLRYARFAAAVAESSGEQIFAFIGPLAIAFALALRITKVSGELSNARRKANETYRRWRGTPQKARRLSAWFGMHQEA